MSRQQPRWGRSANYPAGGNPWNGQPAVVDPGFEVFTPGVDAGAPGVNFAVKNAGLDGIQAAQHTAVASNWIGGVPGTGKPLLDVCRAPGLYGRWFAVADAGGGQYDVYRIRNVPIFTQATEVWKANFGPPNTPELIFDFGTAVVVFSATGTFSRITSSGVTFPTGVAGTHWDIVRGLGNGTSNCFAVAHSGTNTLIFKSTNSGTSFSSVSVPAHFSTYLNGWSSGDTSGTETIFSPNYGTGALEEHYVLVCANSGATAEQVHSTSGFAVGAVVYDEVTNTWLAFASDGTDTRVYRRTSGTWSAVIATISGFIVKDAAASCGVICVGGVPGTYENSDTSTTPTHEVWYALSEDVESWFQSGAGSKDGTRLVPNGISIGGWETTAFFESGMLGLSENV